MIIEGRVFPFLVFAAIFIGVILVTRRYKAGNLPYVRDVPAIKGIEDAVKLCKETGRPLHYTIGAMSISMPTAAPDMGAGLSLLKYTAGLCAKHNVRPIVTFGYPEMLPLIIENVKSAFDAEGKSDKFVQDDMRWISAERHAYSAGVMGTLARENAGANVMLGYFQSETLLILELANRLGSCQVGGTTQFGNLTYMVLACEHVLIASELYAAAAISYKDPVLVGTMRETDLIQGVGLLLIIVGTILTIFGSNVVANLMRM